MSLYSVDFFDRNMIAVHHDVINMPTIDDDYLAPGVSSITITQTDLIPDQGFIYISGSTTFFGAITDVTDGQYDTKVGFKPFISIFNQEVMFDTSLQSSTKKSLETTIKDLITEYWINNPDAIQNLGMMSVAIDSNTLDWNFEIEPAVQYSAQIIEPDQDFPTVGSATTIYYKENSNETVKYIWDPYTFTYKILSDDQHEINKYAIVNLYSQIIQPALTKYGISIVPIVDMTTRTVSISIGSSSRKEYVEADLKNVKVITFTIDEPSRITNKLEIWDATNYEKKVNYYLHTDKTYDTSDSDRIYPVKLEVVAVSPQIEFDEQRYETDDEKKSAYLIAAQTAWNEASKEAADNVFKNIDWKNLIELEFATVDTLVKPLLMDIGQEVLVVHNDMVYSSILTGKKISATSVTLSFGTIRLDLSKKLRLGGSL